MVFVIQKKTRYFEIATMVGMIFVRTTKRQWESESCLSLIILILLQTNNRIRTSNVTFNWLVFIKQWPLGKIIHLEKLPYYDTFHVIWHCYKQQSSLKDSVIQAVYALYNSVKCYLTVYNKLYDMDYTTWHGFSSKGRLKDKIQCTNFILQIVSQKYTNLRPVLCCKL